MKKFLKNCIKVFLMLVMACVIMAKPIQADVGYHSSYSGGSSSSSSSSRRSSSSSSSSSRRSSSSSSSSGELNIETLIIIIVIMTIYIVLKKKELVKNSSNISLNNIARTAPDNTSSVESQIRKIDPMFSAENFMAWSKEVFIKLQTAWMDRKWEEIRPFESNELFEQHRQQLQYLIDKNQINMMERICVRHTHLNSFRQDGDKEIIEMTLISAMKDYTIDADTKKVVQGNPNEDVYMVYTFTFERTKGILTEEELDEVKTTNCPNCGAPTQITSAGKCEYCDSIILTGNHGWVLSNLEGRRGM